MNALSWASISEQLRTIGVEVPVAGQETGELPDDTSTASLDLLSALGIELVHIENEQHAAVDDRAQS